MDSKRQHIVNAIILSGDLGSGKTTAARFIRDKYGFQHLSFVEEIWKPILIERKLEFTRSNLQELGIELINTLGYEKLVDILLSHASSKYIVIDDVRRVDVFKYIESICLRATLIYLDADFETRFPRLVMRDNVKSIAEQKQAELVETETTIKQLREIANYIIINSGSLEIFQKAIDSILLKVVNENDKPK